MCIRQQVAKAINQSRTANNKSYKSCRPCHVGDVMRICGTSKKLVPNCMYMFKCESKDKAMDIVNQLFTMKAKKFANINDRGTFIGKIEQEFAKRNKK